MDLVEEYLPHDIMPIANRYAKCQNTAATYVFEETSNVLRQLDECLKNNNYVEHDYNVFYGQTYE